MRQTRIGMIVVGLVIWLVGIAMTPVARKWTMPGILLGSLMVAWDTFGLLTDT